MDDVSVVISDVVVSPEKILDDKKGFPETRVIDPMEMRPNAFMICREMEGWAREQSREVGGNRNNRATPSHGFQVWALRYAESKGIDVSKYGIKH